MTPAKTRSSNIELLRILAMFMIIIFHISDHCVKVQLTDTASMLRMNNGLFCEPVFYKKLLLLSTFAPMGKIGNVIFPQRNRRAGVLWIPGADDRALYDGT